jgi:hypothetical protein
MKKTQRYERRLAAAREENEISVLQTYKREIREQELRSDASRNGFVKTCCQQEIDLLKAEKEAIEAEVIG